MIKKLSLCALLILLVPKSSVGMDDYVKKALAFTAAGIAAYFTIQQCYTWWQRQNAIRRYRDSEALLLAYTTGDLKKIKLLIDAEVDPSKPISGTALTPLLIASGKGHLEVVKFLLQKNTSIDLSSDNGNGYTLLHTAAENGKYNVADWLIKHGAPLEAKIDRHNITPLQIAIMSCIEDKKNYDIKLIHLLLDRGSSIAVQDNRGFTPFHYVSGNNADMDIAKLLICRSFFAPCLKPLTSGNQPNLQEQCLTTLLKNLNNYDEASLRNYIIPAFANKQVCNANTLMMFADQAPLELQQVIIKLLSQQLPENADKHNPLLEAHYTRHLNKIKEMLAIEDNEGRTALNVAQATNNQNFIKLCNTIRGAAKFSDLALDLQQAVTATINKRLTSRESLQ